MNLPVKTVFAPEEVLSRVALLKRIARDVSEISERHRNIKDLHQHFVQVARDIRSPEIDETVNRLRTEMKALQRQMDALEKEIQDLGGILKDRRKGRVYFYSERDGRKIFLVWELADCNLISWHELDDTFADRMPLDSPPVSSPPVPPEGAFGVGE